MFRFEVAKLVEQFSLSLQLAAIPLQEFRPTQRCVSEPPAKCIGRCNFFHPQIDSGVLFRDTAGPNSIDKDAIAVLWFDGFINALQLEHRHLKSKSDFAVLDPAFGQPSRPS
jgi:hypothetical protein